MTTDKTDNRPQISDGGMTYEDVKRIRENPGADVCDNNVLSRMIDAAVEKQIAKKPRHKKTDITVYCPVCGECVGYIDALSSFVMNYCNNCGQKIDTGDQ